MITVAFKSEEAAKQVIDALKKGEDVDGNKLLTWELSASKTGITHVGESKQWKMKGVVYWPRIPTKSSLFTVKLNPDMDKDDDDVSAVYDGRFMELMWLRFRRYVQDMNSDGKYEYFTLK